MRFKVQGPYSQHFICFITYEFVQKARVLYNIWLDKIVRDKRSSLLESFMSYEEIEML
jgi:hypothetical protein